MKKISIEKTNDQVSAPTQNRSGQPSFTMFPHAPHPSCPSNLNKKLFDFGLW